MRIPRVTLAGTLGLSAMLLVCAALPQPLPAEDPGVHVIRGATVVTSPGRVIEDATIVVRDGLIVAVGRGVTAPPDAWEWDAEGRWIYPGMIDAHVPASSLATGKEKKDTDRPATAHPVDRVNPERLALDGLSISDDKRATWRKAGITTVHVAPEGGIFRGRSAVLNLRDGALSDAVIVQEGSHHIALEHGGWGDRTYPGSKMGAVAVARQTLLDARWYEDAWDAYLKSGSGVERPMSSTALAALGDVARGRTKAVLVSDSFLDTLRLGRLASEFELNVRIVGTGDEYRRLPEIAEMRVPLVVPVAFPAPPKAKTEAEWTGVSLGALRRWDRAPSNPVWLENAGVTFALSASGLDAVDDFRGKIRKAIERGLSEEDALAAVTSVPARLLGLANRIGAVERGKIANLLVTDGPLFDEETKIREVWVEGIRHEILSDAGEEVEGDWDVALESPAMDATIQAVLSLKAKKGSLRKKKPGSEQAGEAGEEDEAGEPEARDEDRPDEGATRPGKKKGKKGRKGKEDAVELSEVQLRRGGRFRFRMDPEKLGLPAGDTTVEGRLEFLVSDLETARIQAIALLADGSELRLTGTRSEAGEEPDPEGEDEEEEEEAEPEEYPQTAPAPEGGPLRTPSSVLVRNATIWTSGPRGILEDADLLVRNGRIAAVGRGLSAPRGAEVIDASGMHVTPGLIDAHSHTAIQGGVNEGTNAITSEVRIQDVVNSETQNIYRQLAGGLTAMHLLHGSANPIGGQAATVKLRWGSAPGDMFLEGAVPTIKFALGENVKQSNWGDDFSTRFPQTRMGVEQFFRERFLEALDYKAAQREWKRGRKKGLPPRRDLQLEALVEILDGERLIHCHSYRQDEILMLIRVAEEFGFTIGTFQHVLEGYKVANEIAAHGAAASTFSDWWAYKFEVYDAIPYNGAIMWDRGVNVSFNSDSSELARRMNLEAAKAVKYGGLPPEEALKLVTINPAIQVGAQDRVGSLEPGKDADFVIWSDDPLSTLSHAEQTWVDGSLYFDRDQDVAHRSELRDEREALIAKARKRQDEKGRSPGGGRRRYSPGEDDDAAHHSCMPSAMELGVTQ